MSEPENDDAVISASKKLWCLLIAAAVVVLAALAMEPQSLRLTPFFPIGMAGLLPNGPKLAIGLWMLGFPSFLGWGCYGVYLAIMFRMRTARNFYSLFAVLCLLLALNLGGCQKTLEAASEIH